MAAKISGQRNKRTDPPRPARRSETKQIKQVPANNHQVEHGVRTVSRSGETVVHCENVVDNTVITQPPKRKQSSTTARPAFTSTAAAVAASQQPQRATSTSQAGHQKKSSQVGHVRRSIQENNKEETDHYSATDELKKTSRKGSWHAHISQPSRQDELAAGGQFYQQPD